MSDDVQTIMLSALQHYAYCPRQFALIYIEQVWSENFYTAHGNLLYQRGVVVIFHQLQSILIHHFIEDSRKE